MNTRLDLKVLITACGVTAGVASAAMADSAATQDGPPQHPVAIEEVLVTAQKRIENIQDVPKSVDVVTQDDFNKAATSDLNALAATVPSITSTSGTSNQYSSAPAIRGIKTITSSVGVQSKTGVLVDEIAQPTFSTLANNLIDVERVEVFAGPQSTLSGRNAAGGLISITTRAPSRTPEFDVGFLRTTDGQIRGTVYGSAPINDQFAFSLSGYKDHRDGDIYSPLEGEHIGDTDNKGGRGKLQWQPSDALTATLTGYYMEGYMQRPAALGSGGYGFAYVSPAAAAAVANYYPLWNGKKFSRETFSPEHGFSKTRDRGISLHVDYDIDRLGTLSSLTNYQKSNQPSTIVLFGGPRIGPFNEPDLKQYADIATNYFSQELRLVSEDMDPWTYIIGGIYSESDLKQPYVRPGQVFGAIDWDRSDDIKSGALFGRATYNFTDDDSLTAGLRYQRDKNAYTWRMNDIAGRVINGVENYPLGDFSGASSYGFFAGELSFKHNFTNSVNGYVTFARTESGEAYDLENFDKSGLVGVTSPGGLQPLKSEVAKSIEIGLKSHWLDDRMLFNIDGFWTKYDNYQIQSTDPSATPPIIRTYAIGEVETKGVELSTALQATDALRFDFNAAYMDAKIVKYAGAPCYTGQEAMQGCVNNTQDLNGADMPEAPRWKYTAAADYTIFLPSLAFDGNFGAFYRYQGKMHFDTFNDPNTQQAAYGIMNLYAGINTHDDRYRVQFFVNNVFDKHYYTNLMSDPVLANLGGIVINGTTDQNAFRYAGVRLDAKFK